MTIGNDFRIYFFQNDLSICYRLLKFELSIAASLHQSFRDTHTVCNYDNAGFRLIRQAGKMLTIMAKGVGRWCASTKLYVNVLACTGHRPALAHDINICLKR